MFSSEDILVWEKGEDVRSCAEIIHRSGCIRRPPTSFKGTWAFPQVGSMFSGACHLLANRASAFSFAYVEDRFASSILRESILLASGICLLRVPLLTSGIKLFFGTRSGLHRESDLRAFSFRSRSFQRREFLWSHKVAIAHWYRRGLFSQFLFLFLLRRGGTFSFST